MLANVRIASNKPYTVAVVAAPIMIFDLAAAVRAPTDILAVLAVAGTDVGLPFADACGPSALGVADA